MRFHTLDSNNNNELNNQAAVILGILCDHNSVVEWSIIEYLFLILLKLPLNCMYNIILF